MANKPNDERLRLEARVCVSTRPAPARHRSAPGLGICMTASPVSEWEQWALAHHYVQQHGSAATLVVADRADQLLCQGEVLGAKTYIAIMRKCDQLLTRDGESVH